MRVQILIDNPGSWALPYGKDLLNTLLKKGIEGSLIHSHQEIKKGDVLVLLSCEKILKNFDLNRYNLVVHASDLPKGRGWSPLTWQILEGKNEITLTLFEAAEKVDSGLIYMKDTVVFEGHELIDELRKKIGEKSNEMILSFISSYPNITGYKQKGEPTFYPKRSAKDSELDVNKTIAEQFNLLRVADKERYPAFFYFKGHKYLIKIEKADEAD